VSEKARGTCRSLFSRLDGRGFEDSPSKLAKAENAKTKNDSKGGFEGYLKSLLKPRRPKPRRSVEENCLPLCLSLTCSRRAGNADTVNRLKRSSSQYVSVHSNADWGNYSNSTYSLYASVNR